MTQMIGIASRVFFGFIIFLIQMRVGISNFNTLPLFYIGVACALTTALILLFTDLLLLKKINLSINSNIKSNAIFLSFSLNITFLVIFPVTFDRSVTVYLLSCLNVADESGATNQYLEQRLIAQYVKDFDAVGRRMHEQEISGNVKKIGQRYYLTPAGKSFVSIGKILADFLGYDKRLVYLEDMDK